MKLITETIQNVKVLKEQDKNEPTKKNYYVEGIFMQGDIVNQNGRRYPVGILQKEVNRYNSDYVAKNRAFGELGHPEDATINLERVSHLIKEIKQDGSNFIGKAKIMDTPYGRIVKSLVDEGAQLAVSSRGLGSLRAAGDIQEVQEDFFLACAADIVADPSAPEAFVRGIMENKEWIFVNGKYVSKDIEHAKKVIKETSQRNLEETMIKLFKEFMWKL